MRNNKTYRREELEVLTSHQLDEILRAEVEKPGMDDEVILQILDILESREADSPTIPDIDVDAAWNEFKTSYIAQPEEPLVVHKKSKKKIHRPLRWIGSLAAMLAIVCMLIVAAPEAQGAMNIFEIFGRWTESIFEFFNPGTSNKPQQEYVFQTDHPGLQQIYDAVVELGVTQPVVPTWIPDGYKLNKLDISAMYAGSKVYADFADSDRYITIVIRKYDKSITNEYTKDEEDIVICEMDGIKHYIMCNEGKWFAVWTIDDTECLIMVDHPRETLLKMLRSIYTEDD